MYEITQSRTPLVYDIQELFRWIVDLSVIQLLEKNSLKKSDFVITENYHTRLKENTASLLIDAMRFNFALKVPYKSGKSYPNSDSLDTIEYWKKMSKVFSEYRNYRESKLDCVESIAKRKHLIFRKESIKYVGKEVHDLESSKVFGVSDDSMTYENEQEKLCRIIDKLTLEKAESLGISRRTYFDWKKKIKEGNQIVLKNKLKNKLKISKH